MVSDFIAQTKAAIARLTDPNLVGTTIELTHCDREPIHTPEKIQPHGVMLVLEALVEDSLDDDSEDQNQLDDWKIIQISQNADEHLGRLPEALLGQALSCLINESQRHDIQSCLDRAFEAANPLLLDIPVADKTKRFTGVVHRSNDVIILELEPSSAAEGISFFNFHALVKQPMGRIRQTTSLKSLCEVAVKEVHKITEYDRVMVYRFAEDGSGSVIAESINEGVDSYLGLHYPATDISEQAKYLYLLNLLRMIPDIDYRPVGLVSVRTDTYEDEQLNKQQGEQNTTKGNRSKDNVKKNNTKQNRPKKNTSRKTSARETSPKQNSIQKKITSQSISSSVSPGYAPVDMSFASLRSVSELHVNYLRNMGVRATLVISLVQNNKLWGLLVCHHNSPRYLPYAMRTVCEFLGQVIALELNAKVENEDADYKLKLKTIQTYFLKALPESENLKDGLTKDLEKLLSLTGSAGVAFCEKEDIHLFGETPKLSEVQQMMLWLNTQFAQNSVYHTASLVTVYNPAKHFKASASGLLALAISKVQNLYVLWFRPEILQTVNWAGNPERFYELNEEGEEQLSPRTSFELWQQTVEATSNPWKPWEIEAALELRSTVIGVVLQKADELAELNSELTRSNIELDSFAYIASHDLKEPLRGIHNYSSFLIEDYGSELGEDGIDKLHTLMRLTKRMEDLISSLLHYSRLGRADLQLEWVSIRDVVNEVIEMVNISKPGRKASKVSTKVNTQNIGFEVSESLPVVECDRTQITELYTNLITNAIKYNDKNDKQIEIGTYPMNEALVQGIIPDEVALPISRQSASIDKFPLSSTVFYVRDNGIGIREKHLESVFRIFKRLHAPKRYGGGTGAGLTIAKKIVERHHGRIWIVSEYGEGSTFYFTLEASNNRA